MPLNLVSTSVSTPPPVGGWDTRESLADMPETHAVILSNFFPETDVVRVRRGNTSHATGMSGEVQSLIEYVPKSGTGALFAANAGNIYDVTSAGAVGAAVSSGHSNDKWQHVNLGTSAGQFVRCFNGADTPLLYNGSTWATTAITGPTATNLVWGNLHQRRLWVGEINSLSAWYLAANAVSGSATEFSLAGIARLGGFIMAMGTWTRDAGDGMDDVAGYLTSEGEAIIYQGTDPAAVATWGLIGVFRIGKPIGRRCLVKAGSDLILVTQDGFVPLSGILTMDRRQTRLVALSDQISRAVNEAVRRYGDLHGWQPILYPKSTQLIFNIPLSSQKSEQYVFNTITGAPCKYEGVNALCFGLLNDELYWGGRAGVVFKADSGTTDDGTAISADGMQAFNYFGSPQATKAFKEAEPIFESDGNPNASIEMNTDFQQKPPVGVAAASNVSSGVWGIAKWGSGRWGTALQIYRGWRGVRGTGRAGSIRVRIDTSLARPGWVSTNVRFIKGGQI